MGDADTNAPRSAPRDRPLWWVQVLLIVGFAWAYDEIRSLHGNVVAAGVRHGRRVLQIDHTLHIAWTVPLNHWLNHHDTVADVLAGYYVIMHLGMTSFALLMLWIVNGRKYRYHRNVLILLSLIGMAVYWLYPVAPPRLLGADVHDTVEAALPFAYHVETASANLYAAMPSLHMAWALWVTIALWSITTRWWLRVLEAAHPIITAITVLATGNHFTTDLLSGIALTLLGYALAWAALRAYRGFRGGAAPPPVRSTTEQRSAISAH